MNTLVTLACLLAVAAVSNGNAIGYGYGSYGYAPTVIKAPIWYPSAVSTSSQWKGISYPVIKTISAPLYIPKVYSYPIYKSYYPSYLLNNWGYNWNGLGYGWGKYF